MPNALAAMKLKDFPSWGFAAAKAGIKLTDDDLKDSMVPASAANNPSLNVALETYFKDKNRSGVDAAIARMIRATATDSPEVKKQKQARAEKLKVLLSWLVGQLDVLSPPAAHAVNPKITTVLGSDAVAQIQAMRLWACNDASTFKDQIADGFTPQVLNRQWAATQDDERNKGYGSTLAAGRKATYEEGDLTKTYAALAKCELAICTTFAMAAGAVLLEAHKGAKTKFRLELVGASNHCFAIVNRVGDLEGGKVGPGNAGKWGKDVIVIDPWAGSLGHPIMCVDTKDYPAKLKKYMAEKLNRTFELPAS